MKRGALIILALALAAGFLMVRRRTLVRAEVFQGESAREVARTLKSKGVIFSPLAFRVASRLTRWDRGLRPGVYVLKKGMLSVEALWLLSHKEPESVRIVIPEGFRAKQIAERLEANGVTKAEDFEAYVLANRLEGYLFPTTYFFFQRLRAEEAAHRMHKEFEKEVLPEIQKAGPPVRLSEYQIVTLASIVEREATKVEEKPMVAAVYLNRLARHQRLAADPTIQYALGYWKRGLTLKDLHVVSPYNTYVHYGLPPGPICSPGVASVRAVLSPAKTKALYFVADGKGGHTFTDTFEQHLKAKFKAKRDRRHPPAS